MAFKGATLQSYSQELVKGLEKLKNKRANLQGLIEKEELEKLALQKEIDIITVKLNKINESLEQKTAAKAEFDRCISEAEAAFEKLIETSQVVVEMIAKQTDNLDEVASKLINTDI